MRPSQFVSRMLQFCTHGCRKLHSSVKNSERAYVYTHVSSSSWLGPGKRMTSSELSVDAVNTWDAVHVASMQLLHLCGVVSRHEAAGQQNAVAAAVRLDAVRASHRKHTCMTSMRERKGSPKMRRAPLTL